MNLSLEEQEVHFSMSADDPATWHAYSDYPKWQRRLEKIGATLVRVADDGKGRFYMLRANQLSLRKGLKREVSQKQRDQAAKRMQELLARRSNVSQDTQN